MSSPSKSLIALKSKVWQFLVSEDTDTATEVQEFNDSSSWIWQDKRWHCVLTEWPAEGLPATH